MTPPTEPDSFALCERGADCAVLFARTPVPGRVKSRLLPTLSPEQACALHCAATNDTAALLAKTLPNAALWLFRSAESSTKDVMSFALPPRFRCAVQESGTLGDRMAAAFRRAFASGARRVVIFGSDSPTVPPSILPQAFRALHESDVVIGPAADGGYYLIGCRRFDAAVFQDVEWSTPRTCTQTVANACRLGYSTTLLEGWFDIDTWDDVERLLADARHGVPLPPHLAAFFAQFRSV